MLNYQPVVLDLETGVEIQASKDVAERLTSILVALRAGRSSRVASTINTKLELNPGQLPVLQISAGRIEGFASRAEFEGIVEVARELRLGAVRRDSVKLISTVDYTDTEVMMAMSDPVSAAHRAVDAVKEERELFNSAARHRLINAMSLMVTDDLTISVPNEARELEDLSLLDGAGEKVVDGAALRLLRFEQDCVERADLDRFLERGEKEMGKFLPPDRAFALARALDVYLKSEGKSAVVRPAAAVASVNSSHLRGGSGAYPGMR